MQATWKKKKINDLFLENAQVIELCLKTLSEAIFAFADGNYPLMEQKAEETIQLEKRQDRLREVITEKIFSNENMAFSRPDRLFLVNEMDDIGDEAEIVARKMRIYKPKPDPELLAGIKNISSEISEIGKAMNELVAGILKDFDIALKKIEININIRRDIREKHWKLMQRLYELDLPAKDFTYYLDLIKKIAHIADICEALADNLYGLILKYKM
jgi:predicted phosphate transport protein (TIGR00153 family)